jgi:hypothetical protein
MPPVIEASGTSQGVGERRLLRNGGSLGRFTVATDETDSLLIHRAGPATSAEV